jgi:signal transduction histidine kinase
MVIEDPGGAPVPNAGEPREWVLIGGIAIVVLLTGSTGWLVYRDVRREVRVAELRSQFVSSITHELKTPLTSIRMFAEMLQMSRGQSVEKDQKHLDTIVHESERLTRLVNDVLLFARFERGEMTFRFGPACLKDVVLDAAEAMEYQLAGLGYTLHQEIEKGDWNVRADRDTLIQAILNLLTNAMKFSGDSREIRLRLYRQNAGAVIEVVDYGIGITKEEQDRIFDNFFRASNPEVQNVPGAGIGLSLVSQIVRAHRGEVRVASRPGAGSRFSIVIPLE